MPAIQVKMHRNKQANSQTHKYNYDNSCKQTGKNKTTQKKTQNILSTQVYFVCAVTVALPSSHSMKS